MSTHKPHLTHRHLSLSPRTQNLWTRPSRAPSRPSSHLSRPQRPSSSASCFALLRNVITVMRYSACWISSSPPNTCWRASNRLHVWVLIHFSGCWTSALTHFTLSWRYTCIVVQSRDSYCELRYVNVFIALELAQNALFFDKVVELDIHGKHIFAHNIQCDYSFRDITLSHVSCMLLFQS